MRKNDLRSKGAGNVGGLIGLTVLMLLAIVLLSGSFYVIDTGHVGVERTMGKVDLEEKGPGLNFKIPLLTQAYEFSAKEIALDLNDLKPKAADNLSLQDLDVTVYYRTAPFEIADLMVKYANASRHDEGAILPAYGIVYREARGAVYEEVSKVDSLRLHRQRDALQTSIQESLQARLEDKDGDALMISRVVVRARDAALRDLAVRFYRDQHPRGGRQPEEAGGEADLGRHCEEGCGNRD